MTTAIAIIAGICFLLSWVGSLVLHGSGKHERGFHEELMAVIYLAILLYCVK